MKRNLQTIICASAVTVIACSAVAQVNPSRQTDRPGSTPQSTPTASSERRAAQLNGATKATDLIGMNVKNLQDEKVGKVEELAVDVESGRVLQVIISSGGFAGIGDSLTAVPPGALRHNAADKSIVIDATKEKLKAAPKFDMSKWNESAGTNQLTSVYRHYGQESSLDFFDGTSRNDAPETVSKRRADGTWEDRTEGRGSASIPTSRLADVQRASKLIGTAVKNRQDEKLGDVKDILVDVQSGRVVAVVISSGGFLGLGDELSAVPSPALTLTADRKALQLDATKEMLARAPHFKANQWPDFGEATFADSVYRSFGMEPYFSTNGVSRSETIARDRTNRTTDRPAVADADNTARNERDRNDRTMTPVEQGNSKADLDTTARIRKEIVANKSISVNAQNVKVISNNGKVTLRGPVETEEEKRIIGEIANRIARSENVNNQLEVKLVPTGRSQDGRPPR